MHAKANTEVTLRMSENQAHHLNGVAKNGRMLVLENSEAQVTPLDEEVIETLNKIHEWLDKVLSTKG